MSVGDGSSDRIFPDDLLLLKKSLLKRAVDFRVSEEFYSGVIKDIADKGNNTVCIVVGALVIRDKFYSNLWIPVPGRTINFAISKEDKIQDLDSSGQIWIELKNKDTMTIYKKR